MLSIVEVFNNVLVLISQVAALNWNDSMYANLVYPHQNTENQHFLAWKVIWICFIH